MDPRNNWFYNSGDDIIEGEFILTDLKDIRITDQERHQAAFYDALASDANNGVDDRGKTPLGKVVR